MDFALTAGSAAASASGSDSSGDMDSLVADLGRCGPGPRPSPGRPGGELPRGRASGTLRGSCCRRARRPPPAGPLVLPITVCSVLERG